MSIIRREVKAWLRRGWVPLVLSLCLSSPAGAAVPAMLKDGLKSPSAKVRIIAMASIAKINKGKDDEATALLIGMLTDPEASVRAAAVDAVSGRADPKVEAALAGLKDDADAAVRSLVAKRLAALDSKKILVDIGEAADLSNAGLTGLVALLQGGVEKALTEQLPAVAVRRGGVAKGYGLLLNIRSVNRKTQGGNGILEVKCELMLVELPGKVFRASYNATAGAGVEGELPKNMEQELAKDAIDACAPSLAKDFIDYAQQRILRPAK